jgi:hypothetical protein
MPLDKTVVQRLADSLAELLEAEVAPLRAEIAQLRAAVERLGAWAGAASAASPGSRSAALLPASRNVPEVASAEVRKTAARPTTADVRCDVPGCPGQVLAKQLCETHYRIMRRVSAAGARFDPRSQRPVAERQSERTCGEPGCHEPHYAKDLCRRHYMAARARERAHAPAGSRSSAAARGTAGRVGNAPSRSGPRAMGETGASGKLSAPASGYAAGSPSPSGTLFALDPRSRSAASLDLETEQEAAPTKLSDAELIASDPVLSQDPSLAMPITWVTSDPNAAMPTSEVVARVVQQYRGGLGKVAEVLGRNRRSLMELLEKLNLMEHVVTVRNTERERIVKAPLVERLTDLLFREKLLEDLGCLKEVDEATRRDVQARCAALAKTSEMQEDVLQKLGAECGLEEAGLKRLVWRYDLRRQLRHLKSKTPAVVRSRT